MKWVTAKLVRQEIVDDVPARWAGAYPADKAIRPHFGDDKQLIAGKLAQLVKPLEAEQVDAIIGNSSWTECRCDRCGENHDVIYRFGDEPDYEARYLDLCAPCVQQMALEVIS